MLLLLFFHRIFTVHFPEFSTRDLAANDAQRHYVAWAMENDMYQYNMSLFLKIEQKRAPLNRLKELRANSHFVLCISKSKSYRYYLLTLTLLLFCFFYVKII